MLHIGPSLSFRPRQCRVHRQEGSKKFSTAALEPLTHCTRLVAGSETLEWFDEFRRAVVPSTLGPHCKP